MKIVAFVGRIHHYDKMRSVIGALRDVGHEVVLVCADNAINIDPPRAPELMNHLSRWMTGFRYDMGLLEPLVGMNAFWSTFSQLELQRVMYSGDRFMAQAKPDVVLVLHTDNYWGAALSYLGKKHGAMTVSMQEGIITSKESEAGKYKSAIDLSDLLLCWSDADLEYFPGHPRAVAVGPAHLDDVISGSGRLVSFKEKTPLFATPRSDLYRGDLLSAIDFVARTYNNARFKVHPYDYGGLLPHMGKRGYRVVGGDFYTEIKDTSMTISQTSTVVVESIAMEVPVAYIDIDCAGVIDLIPGIPIIDVMWHGTPEYDTAEMKNRIIPLADGFATRRAVEEILK